MTRKTHTRLKRALAGAALAVISSPALAQTLPFPPPGGYTLTAKHSSIESEVAGAAMSMSGKAFMWYRDGTVTAGSPASLDDWRTPYHYSVTPGKTPDDIVAMAISSKDKVYTWYKDGTRSVGTSSDLDYYQEPVNYTLPYKPSSRVRYAPEEIVDIAISAYDTVTAYYANGRYSQGSSTNLYWKKADGEYKAAANRHPSGIIGIAGHKGTLPAVVSWYQDGFHQQGNTYDFGYTKGKPFSQHLTLYAPRSIGAMTDSGFYTPTGYGDVHVVREDMPAVHEPILAPGMTNIALARRLAANPCKNRRGQNVDQRRRSLGEFPERDR